MAREDEEQQQRESASDKTKDFINKTRSAYNDAKNAKQAANVARAGARVAVQGAQAGAELAASAVSAAASSIEIWGPPVAIIAAFVLVAVGGFTILLSVFNPQQTVGGNLMCSRDVGGKCGPASSCTGSSTINQNASCAGDPTSTSSTDVCCVTPVQITPGAQPPIKFYCQYDPHFSPPNSTCNIAVGGCDPTSIAMIVSSFGNIYNPDQVAQANGNMGCTIAGTTFNQTSAAITNWVKPMGYAIQKGFVNPGTTTIDINAVANITASGAYILAGGCFTYKGGTHSDGGHSIVIAGVNPDGTLKVYDPTYCSTGGLRSFNPSTDVHLNCWDGNSGWGFAYAIIKQ